jgi:hypothetical protein
MNDLLNIAKDHQARLRAEADEHRQAAKATEPTEISMDFASSTSTRTAFRHPEFVIGSVFPATR